MPSSKMISLRTLGFILVEIQGFERLIPGGLPLGRTYLISGNAGAGKTLFSLQFLVAGATSQDQAGLYVSFEEPIDSIRQNVAAVGWDLAPVEKSGKLVLADFVLARMFSQRKLTVRENFDLSPILIAITDLVKKHNVKRVVLDSITVLVNEFGNAPITRRELVSLKLALDELGCITFMISEIPEAAEGISRFGFEEFVADGLIILRTMRNGRERERLIEIYKLRGREHVLGQFPYSITNSGIRIHV